MSQGLHEDFVRGTAETSMCRQPGLDAIQKYASAPMHEKAEVKQARNGSEWTRPRPSVRAAVDEVAKDLVELYAARQEREGLRCYGEDTVWQREFEEMFPFEETDDQLTGN